MKLGNGKIGMKDKLIDVEKNLKTEKLIDEDIAILQAQLDELNAEKTKLEAVKVSVVVDQPK